MIPVEFMHPWALALAPLAAFLVWQARRTLAPLSPRRRRASLAARLVLFFLLVLALSDPRWLGATRKQSVAFLVDTSDSVRAAAIAAATKTAEKLPPALASAGSARDPDSSRWFAFAGSTRVVAGPAAFKEFDRRPLVPSRTDLASALRLAHASLPADRVRSVVVFTDGVTEPAAWDSLLASLAADDIRVIPVTVARPDDPEALVRALRAPARVRQREPFRISTDISSNRAQPATLRVFRNGILVQSSPVTLAVGANRFEFTQVIESDALAEYVLRVEARDDTFADNNELTTLVRAEGEPRVLMLTDAPAQARYLSQALKQEGIRLDIRPARGAPLSLGDLQNYALLILDNVSAVELGAPQLKLYASYVTDFGGGLLMLGGDQSFGLGGYHRTPIDEVLPLRSDFQADEEAPSLGLVLIIDKSGSMSGERIEMARAAAAGAIDLLTPKDYAGIVIFDNDASWAAEIQPVVDRHDFRRRIASIEADGGTNLSPAMDLAYRGLAPVPAKLKHVIVLSDGQSEPGNILEIASQMAQAGMTVSTVGLGEGIDVDNLTEIARRGNGRYYYTANSQDVPQILAKETVTAAKSALQEFPFAPRRSRDAGFLGGIDFAAAPFLYGYVRTELRPTAELWLATERGEPLLATWRHGLGHAGAFTSDARARWATEWLRWDGYGRFWVQTVRHLMRTDAAAPFAVAVAPEPGADGDGFRITLDAVDPAGDFVTKATGRVLVLDPSGERRSLDLAPAGPGRFTVRVPAPARGNHHFDIRLDSPAFPDGAVRAYAAAAPSFPDEYKLAPPDSALLDRIAAATRGVRDPADLAALLAADPRAARHEHPLWPWLAAAALLTFLVDVSLKRLPSPLRL
ncbi:MAG: VWA domain-containing protein [Elusimicrobiota bacterium]|jgi:Mg-chelatase subunit ChlD